MEKNIFSTLKHRFFHHLAKKKDFKKEIYVRVQMSLPFFSVNRQNALIPITRMLAVCSFIPQNAQNFE